MRSSRLDRMCPEQGTGTRRYAHAKIKETLHETISTHS